MKKIKVILLSALFLAFTVFVALKQWPSLQHNYISHQLADITQPSPLGDFNIYKQETTFSFNGIAHETTPMGFLKPDLSFTEQKQTERPILIIGSTYISAITLPHNQRVAPLLNLFSTQNKIFPEKLFIDHTVPGNNFKQTVTLLLSSTFEAKPDLFIIYLKIEDFISSENSLFTDWDNLVRLVATIKRGVAEKHNADIIPVFIISDKTPETSYYPLTELFANSGLHFCKVTIKTEAVWPSHEDNQEIATQTLHCLNRLNLQYLN